MAKAKAPATKAVYDQVSAIGLGFPGAEVKLSHGAPSFHVRGKMFLVFVDNHHGDGRLAVWCKATFDDQRRLTSQNPARFFVPPYVGVKGWVGVRLDAPAPDPIELAILAEEAWASVVPKSIASGAAPLKKAKPLALPTTDRAAAEKALDRVAAICEKLPESTCERSGTHATWRAKKKPFAYFLDNHHGDEMIAVAVKTSLREQAALVRKEPTRFYVPQYIGKRGWVAVRLDVGKTDWKDVEARLRASHATLSVRGRR